jgi:beta-glucosidase-like glycosyl hydrolase
MKLKTFLLFMSTIMFIGQLRAGWAEQTLKKLTLEEKVGQLFMIGVVSEPEKYIEFHKVWGHHVDQKEVEKLIRDYHIGGLIFFSGTAKKQVNMTNVFQKISKLPLLVGQDCEFGLGMRLKDAMSFPKNGTLGKLDDELLVYGCAKKIGKQCRAIGVHVNFAPVVDINSNPKNPIIGVRSFGSCKELVARLGKIFAKGLRDGGIFACAKHFPGHGNTDVDSHLSLPVVSHSKERLFTEELYPFKHLIDSGVDAIMTAHLSVPELDSSGTPASLSRLIVTDLLRKELKFDGLIFTDAMSMGGILKLYSPKEAALLAIKAGNDILLCPLNIKKSIKHIIQAVRKKDLSEKELDSHILRILKAKEKLGLHKNCVVETENIYKILYN